LGPSDSTRHGLCTAGHRRTGRERAHDSEVGEAVVHFPSSCDRFLYVAIRIAAEFFGRIQIADQRHRYGADGETRRGERARCVDKGERPLGDRDILTSSIMLKNTTIIEGAMTNRTSRWMPLLTGPLIAFLAAAVVGLWASHREESSAQLEGQWVGTVGDDFRF